MSTKNENIIGHNHPADGWEWDCQCARCGSSMLFEDCELCGGDGTTASGELYAQDPFWYDEDDIENCDGCGGTGGEHICISGPEWCESHPLPGREQTPRHMPEWFVVECQKPA